MDKYVVERSTDARNFIAAGNVKPKENPGTSSNYSYFDAEPNKGDNFYRVKAIDKAGEVKYTEVVKVKVVNNAGTITILANPVTGNIINLLLSDVEKGVYVANLVNQAGQVVYTSGISHAGGTATKVIKASNSLPSGVYNLTITGSSLIKTIAVLID
jgi:hypothetical protein